VFQDIITIS